MEQESSVSVTALKRTLVWYPISVAVPSFLEPRSERRKVPAVVVDAAPDVMRLFVPPFASFASMKPMLIAPLVPRSSVIHSVASWLGGLLPGTHERPPQYSDIV